MENFPGIPKKIISYFDICSVSKGGTPKLSSTAESTMVKFSTYLIQPVNVARSVQKSATPVSNVVKTAKEVV
jgi:hypothetical protein